MLPTNPTLLINILAPQGNMSTDSQPRSATIVDTSRFEDCTFAHTAGGVRAMLRTAKTVRVRVTVSADAYFDVRVSKRAVIDAISDGSDDDVVGAIMWDNGDFVLCIGEAYVDHADSVPLMSHRSRE